MSKTLQAVMSILGNLQGKSFLDCFSGTGKVAAKALSCGADPVVAIECIKQRAKEIERTEGLTLCLSFDVRRAVPWLIKKGYQFDYIYADPPYNDGWGREFPLLLANHIAILKKDGIVIFEHSKGEEVLIPTGWKCCDRRVYGASTIDFLAKEVPNE